MDDLLEADPVRAGDRDYEDRRDIDYDREYDRRAREGDYDRRDY
jgi:hypothetical protein